jgi:hypothetical protein
MAVVNVKYRVKMMESERGWGQDYWDVDFDTRAEAEAYMHKINSQNTELRAPDYYMQALRIEMLEA